jgi:hypothetical protein
MLPPWIIEKIKKREEEERRKRDQPQPQLPVPEPLPPPPKKDPANPDGDRGVVIIEPGKDDESKVGEVISFY